MPLAIKTLQNPKCQLDVLLTVQTKLAVRRRLTTMTYLNENSSKLKKNGKNNVLNMQNFLQ